MSAEAQSIFVYGVCCCHTIKMFAVQCNLGFHDHFILAYFSMTQLTEGSSLTIHCLQVEIDGKVRMKRDTSLCHL